MLDHKEKFQLSRYQARRKGSVVFAVTPKELAENDPGQCAVNVKEGCMGHVYTSINAKKLKGNKIVSINQ